MPAEVQYDVCPETGIGCVMVIQDEGLLKIDLMPDEVQALEDKVKAGDMSGAKELLTSIDAGADGVMDGAILQSLAQEIR